MNPNSMPRSTALDAEDGRWQSGARLVSVLGGALTGMGIEKGTGTFWQYRCIGTGTKMGTGMGSTSTWGFHSSAGRKGSCQSPRYAAPIRPGT